MTIGEASRQYQVALEHERRGKTACAGMLTMQDELDRAHEDTLRAEARLLDLMVMGEIRA